MMYWGFHGGFFFNQFNKEWMQLCLGRGDQQAGILLIPTQALAPLLRDGFPKSLIPGQRPPFASKLLL